MPPEENEIRVGVVFKGSLADALIEESEKTMATFAKIVRAATMKYLAERGYAVEDNVSWGGSRRRKQDESGEIDSPEPAAVA